MLPKVIGQFYHIAKEEVNRKIQAPINDSGKLVGHVSTKGDSTQYGERKRRGRQ